MKPKCQPERGMGSRNIYCGFYDRCLDIAINKCWGKWNCGRCRHSNNYEAAPDMMLFINHSIPYYEFVN